MSGKDYKFITVYEIPHQSAHGKPVYLVRNSKSDVILAGLAYFPKWRQYIVDYFAENTIFSSGCLADIADFLKNHAGKEKVRHD